MAFYAENAINTSIRESQSFKGMEGRLGLYIIKIVLVEMLILELKQIVLIIQKNFPNTASETKPQSINTDPLIISLLIFIT